MEQEFRADKIFNLNPKHIIHDEDEGIGRFLINIEANAAGNGVVADTYKIAYTCSATSSKGADHLGLLYNEDFLYWNKFKAKLFIMESQSIRSFEIKFCNDQRKPDQPCALWISKLIDFYRKSRAYESGQELNATEIYMIKRRFIDGLELTLAKLLEDKLSDTQYRNEDMTKSDILASRTIQLGETFRIGIHQPKSNTSCSIFLRLSHSRNQKCQF